MMPLGAFRINSLAKFTVTAVAEVIRAKIGVTALGDAKVSTAQSQFGGTSAVFDGTGDYLNFDPAGFTSGDNFTFEFFIRFAAVPTSGQFQMIGSSAANSNRYFSYTNNGGTLRWEIGIAGTSGSFFQWWNDTVSANTWYHIAFVKNGASLAVYRDGSARTSSGTSGTMTTDKHLFNDSIGRIGAWNNAANSVNGHIDELRISKTARYTANFTPSTTPFTNDANTLLLLHMDGTNNSTVFEDDNGVGSKKGITAIGDAKVSTAQSQFGGASLLLTASPEAYLTIRHSSDMATGTGAFTVEGWFRPVLAASSGQGVGSRFWFFKGVNSATGFGLGVTTDGIRFRGPSQTDLVYTGSVSSSAWSHIAFVWDGTNKIIYLNGTSVATATASINVTNTDNYTIGHVTGNFAYDGYIDEVRVSNIARYTANFTAPTAPFTDDANTLLLVHMDGTNNSTVFIDDNGIRSQKGISAFGNAKVDTAQSKFGGASAVFDGTGDYLQIIPSSAADLGIGSNNFTIEFWVRFVAISTTGIILDTRGNPQNGNGWTLYVNNSNLRWFWNGGDRITSSTISTNTWYHVALVRSGNDHKLYIDGTQSGSTYTNTITYVIGSAGLGLWIGDNQPFPGIGQGLNGNLDEFRISNIARYTANFTPSTTPFQNDSNTLLLLHMDGTNNSTVFTDDNGVTPDHDYGA